MMRNATVIPCLVHRLWSLNAFDLFSYLTYQGSGGGLVTTLNIVV